MKKKSTKGKAAKGKPAGNPLGDVTIDSLHQLPALFTLIDWHINGDPEKTKRFLASPASFLKSLGIKVSPMIAKRFEKKVRPNLRFVDRVASREKRTGSASSARLSLAGKKWDKIFPKKGDGPAFNPPRRLKKGLHRNLSSNPGNFAIILQLSESFYQSMFAFIMQNYAFFYIPGPLSNAGDEVSANYEGWFLVYFKVILDLLDPRSEGIQVAVSQLTQDALTLSGTVTSEISGSSDGQTWSAFSAPIKASYAVEAPLTTAPSFDLPPVSPGLSSIGVSDIALTNVIGASTAHGPTVTGLDGMNLLAVTFALTEYFNNYLPLVPIMGDLPTLAGNIPLLNFTAFGLTIPTGGVQPIVSMQYGNPSAPFRTPLLFTGEDMVVGLSAWMTEAVIGQNLPSFPFSPSNGVTVSDGTIECVDGSVQLTVTGTAHTCDCWFDADFSLTVGFTFFRTVDGAFIPYLNQSSLSSSDLTIWEAVFIGIAPLYGAIAAVIVQGFVIPDLESSLAQAISQQITVAGVIPNVMVVPLVTTTILPMFLRIGITGVEIDATGVFVHAKLDIRTTNSILITAYRAIFAGATRIIEMDDNNETASRFFVDLTGNGVDAPLPGQGGSVLYSITAFNSVTVNHNPGLPSSTGIKMTLISNELHSGASIELDFQFAPDPNNAGSFLPLQIGDFRSHGPISADADQMIIDYV